MPHANSISPDVSIAILATRDPSLIEACLRSIDATTTEDLRTEVIVVLGAASPDVEEVVRQAGVKVISSDVNTGTAVACNLAFDAARAPFVFSLHEDTQLMPGCLPRLIKTANALPSAGAIGTRVLNPDGSLQHAGTVLWRTGELTPLVEATAPDLVEGSEPYRVAMTAASAMFVRRSAWEDVGGFDEGYFPFTYVDVDFSVALRAHGHDVVVDPRALTKHRRGASQAPGGGALSTLGFRDWIYERHRDRLLEKWSAQVQALPERPADVARTEVPPEHVREALPPKAIRPAVEPPRADRSLTRPDEQEPWTGEHIPEPLRRRLIHAEHALLDAFALDLGRENADLGEEVRSLWTALQEARAYNEGVYAELTSTGKRLAESISEIAAKDYEISVLGSQLHEAHEQRDMLEQRISALEPELAFLRRRSATYEQIVSGRWWRLRGAVYRLLRRQA